MTVALEQFVAHCTDSGLLTADEIQSAQAGNPAHDAGELAAALVAAGKLTKFQSQVLLGERQDPLVLGNYVVLDKIGEGGMGQVYRALHRRMERIVAIKILPRSATDSETSVKRFQREVKAASQLQHPNIVIAHDADEANGLHFLVMEYVRGLNLTQLVKANGPLSVEAAVDFALQIARGLEYAHDEGIMHRDIKPRNLLLKTPRQRKGSQSGSQILKPTVKILDMGLALWEPNDPRIAPPSDLTQSGAVMGTADYMSPEQAEDTHTADARSDIYSLGCTLYFLLTGHAMYGGDTLIKKLLAHRDEPIPSLRDERPDVSERLEAVYRRMVAKSPDDRYPNMTAVIAELQDLQTPAGDGDAASDNTAQTAALSGVSSDPQLQQFLHAQSQTAAPTITYQEPEEEPEADTVADQAAERTLPSTTSRPTKRAKTGSRKGVLIGIGLLGVIAAIFAGVIIKLKTPNGTIVLEFDQPDMAGAEVTIDDKHIVTIKTGKGEKPITVEADGKKRLLKVTKAGFETFTKEFSLKKGGKQVITVRLVPLKETNPKPSNGAERAIAQWLLRHKHMQTMTLRTGRGTTVVDRQGRLPEETFVITHISTSPYQWTNTDLKRLCGLKSLESLHIGSEEVTDDGTRHLLAMTKLKQLTLRRTGITAKGLEALRQHPSITSFTLYDGKVSSSMMRQLTEWKKLERIGFSNTGIRGDELLLLRKLPDLQALTLNRSPNLGDDVLSAFKQIPGLKMVDLSSTGVTTADLAHFSDLSGLRQLHLIRTKVDAAGVAKLQKALPKCKIVWDGSEQVAASFVQSKGGNVEIRVGKDRRTLKTGDPVPKGGFEIVGFDLNGCRDFSDDDLERLRHFDRLNSLSVAYTQVTDRGMRILSRMKELRTLSVRHTAVSSRILDALPAPEKLLTLHLLGCEIANDDLKKLRRLRSLQLLELTGTKVTGAGLQHLKSLTELKTLRIDGRQFDDAAATHLRDSFKNLEHLYLAGAEIKNSDMSLLRSCRQIKTLTLWNTSVTDSGLPDIAENLPQLTKLFLAENKRISPAGVAKLKKALPKCVILWDGDPTGGRAKNLALRFDGKDDYVEMPTLHYDGSHPITLEARIRVLGPEADRVILFPGSHPTLSTGLNNVPFVLAAASKDGKPHRVLSDKINRAEIHHVAGVYDGKALRLFVDGQSVGKFQQKSDAGWINATEILKLVDRFAKTSAVLGRNRLTAPKSQNSFFHGIIDEVRISKTARYTRNFTPKKRFTPDKDTLALYHFDEGDGDKLTDHSGNNHHGKIHGATWVKEVANGKFAKLDLDREVAQWVLRHQGSVILPVKNREKSFSKLADLPDGAFAVTGCLFPELSDGPETDAFFAKAVNLKRLERFDVGGHVSPGVLKLIAGLPELRRVGLVMSDADLATLTAARPKLHAVYAWPGSTVTDKGLAVLGRLKSLVDFRIDTTKLTDEGVKHIAAHSGLTNLSIYNAAITDASMDRLSILKNMGWFSLSDCPRLTDRGLSRINAFSKLRILAISNVALTDRGLARLRNLTNVYSLILRGTKITNNGVVALKAFPKLSNLSVNNTDIGDGGLEILPPGIQLLALTGTKITDAGIAHLKRQRRLRLLRLDDTTVSDQCIDSLAAIKSLRELNLNGTRFTVAGVATLRKAMPKCEIIFKAGK